MKNNVSEYWQECDKIFLCVAFSSLLVDLSSCVPTEAILDLAAACYTSFFQVVSALDSCYIFFFIPFFLFFFVTLNETVRLEIWVSEPEDMLRLLKWLCICCLSVALLGGK